MSPGDPDAHLAELAGRLARFPEDTYPVQHATARFHLGVALANAGRAEEAEEALVVAARLFGSAPLPVEEAKALNALGAVLRMTGRPEAAAEAFAHAARRFEAHDEKDELAAATYNLALARKDVGAADEAEGLLRRALSLTDAARPLQVATVATELGATLLQRGALEEAPEVLEEAKGQARRAGSLPALGTAANVLGLVHLAAGRAAAAAGEFEEALGAHPRSIRPREHAMAKSNRALALERAGDHRRARLAAAQALSAPEVPPAVHEQAAGVLARLGRDPDDLIVVVLSEDSSERREALIREELVRLAGADQSERADGARAWVRGATEHPDAAALLEPWFAGLLELPPEDMETAARDTVAAVDELDDDGRERFVDAASRAMVRFHVPQWTRLRDTFNRISSERGSGAPWG